LSLESIERQLGPDFEFAGAMFEWPAKIPNPYRISSWLS